MNIPARRPMYARKAALKLLFEQHYLQLVKFAYTYLADSDEAEDVVQSIFISVWEKSRQDELCINVSIQNYLYKSVKNRCLDRLKSLRVRDKHNLLYTEYLLWYDKESGRSEADLKKLIRTALDKLPKRMRLILEMKYLQNRNTTEISELLDISKNSIKTQLQRGKLKLRTILEPDYFV